jgi:hypothetical protein
MVVIDVCEDESRTETRHCEELACGTATRLRVSSKLSLSCGMTSRLRRGLEPSKTRIDVEVAHMRTEAGACPAVLDPGKGTLIVERNTSICSETGLTVVV